MIDRCGALTSPVLNKHLFSLTDPWCLCGTTSQYSAAVFAVAGVTVRIYHGTRSHLQQKTVFLASLIFVLFLSDQIEDGFPFSSSQKL